MATGLKRIKIRASRMKQVALTHLPVAGNFPSGNVHLRQVGFRSLVQYQEWAARNPERIAEWKRDNEEAVRPAVAFTVAGYCAICDQHVDFHTTTAHGKVNPAGVLIPNWREQLVCPSCQMNNRVRAALHLAIQDFGLTPDKQIYITEQFGMVYRWLRGHFNNVVGSEYLDGEPALRLLGINHQDVEALSLHAGTIDHVFSFDVLEHVPHPLTAFESLARTLRPGGRLIMTVPFTIDKHDTTVRAVMHDDGQIEHYLPIEVHGNPLDPDGGSLCFRHFGWDTLEQLTGAGFADAKVHVYHDRGLGHLGGPQSLISATKA
jgi:hypothetical protein